MCLLGGGDVTIIKELKKGPVEDFHGRLNLSKEDAEEIIGMELWD